MSVIYRIVNKFKNNEKVKIILKNIRATAFANILLSCMLIFKMIFFKNNDYSSFNWKSIILVIILILSMRKIKIHPIFYMLFAGIFGIIFQISI